jgi:hypothetical protein
MLEIMGERFVTCFPDIRIVGEIRCGVKHRTRVTPLFPTMPYIVDERILAGVFHVGIREKIPSRIKELIGPPAFRMSPYDEVLNRIDARSCYVRIFGHIPVQIYLLKKCYIRRISPSTFRPAMFKIVGQRFSARVSNLWIVCKIGDGVKVWTRTSSLFPTALNIVEKWVFTLLRHIRICCNIPARVEELIRPSTLRVTFGEEMLTWIQSFSRHVGMRE